jgi:hypothetical protein
VPDWREFVREKMRRVELPPGQQEDVTAELATHFEELYEEQRAEGACERRAVEQAWTAVADWEQLGRRIEQAKGEEAIMNRRTKQLWLPGLVSFWAAMACEIALGGGVLNGRSMFHSHTTQIGLLLQLLCGALGAYLSRRAGGTRLVRLGAALFTSAVLLLTMVSVITISAAGKAMGLGFATLDFALLFKPVLVVILIPMVAMVAGALPFLGGGKRQAIAQ